MEIYYGKKGSLNNLVSCDVTPFDSNLQVF